MLGTASMYLVLLWFALCLMNTIPVLGYKDGSKCGKGQYKSDFLSGGCAQCPRILQQCEDQEIDDARRCFLACMLWHYTGTSTSCPTGTFKSDFLSGGCALCPQKLKYCENEEYEDSVRCFKACWKIISTIKPILSSTPTPIGKSSPPLLPTVLTRKSTEIWKTFPSQLVSHEFSSKKQYERFKDILVFSTSSISSAKQSGEGNMTDIVFGITVSILALLLVVGVCIALWWKRAGRSTTSEQQRMSSNYYEAVRLNNRSNSDQNINGETSASTDEAAVVEDIECSLSIPSASHEDFENMPETHV